MREWDDLEPGTPVVQVRADSLRFGDRLPYFGANVRSVTDRGNGTLVVHFVQQAGKTRTEIRCYADDTLHVVRAGWMRGVA